MPTNNVTISKVGQFLGHQIVMIVPKDRWNGWNLVLYRNPDGFILIKQCLNNQLLLNRQVWIGDDGDNDHRVFLWNLKILSTAAAAAEGLETIYRTNGSSSWGQLITIP